MAKDNGRMCVQLITSGQPVDTQGTIFAREGTDTCYPEIKWLPMARITAESHDQGVCLGWILLHTNSYPSGYRKPPQTCHTQKFELELIQRG